MAFPKNLSSISTNISEAGLKHLATKIDSGEIICKQESLFGGSRRGIFNYEGENFEVEEAFETVISLKRK